MLSRAIVLIAVLSSAVADKSLRGIESTEKTTITTRQTFHMKNLGVKRTKVPLPTAAKKLEKEVATKLVHVSTQSVNVAKTHPLEVTPSVPIVTLEVNNSATVHSATLPQIPQCNPGYVDNTNGNAYYWGCGVDCPGGKYWTNGGCHCACDPVGGNPPPPPPPPPPTPYPSHEPTHDPTYEPTHEPTYEPTYKPYPYDPSTNAGYLLEFTRTNEDCSGTVMSLAGTVTGSVNYYDHGDYYGIDLSTKPRKGGEYMYAALHFGNVDATYQIYNPYHFGGLQCSHTPDDGFIPNADYLVKHGGYYYSHKYSEGTFEKVVGTVYSAYYELHYDSLIACKLGVQPTMFWATLVKGGCYFDPNLYGFEADTHSWLKVIGYDLEDQSLTYTIHNNDDCTDEDPFRKAIPQVAVAQQDFENCQEIETGNWVKYAVL